MFLKEKINGEYYFKKGNKEITTYLPGFKIIALDLSVVLIYPQSNNKNIYAMFGMLSEIKWIFQDFFSISVFGIEIKS